MPRLTAKVGLYEYLTPVVVHCEYADRQPSGKLLFPVFVRQRTDKGAEECILEPEE